MSIRFVAQVLIHQVLIRMENTLTLFLFTSFLPYLKGQLVVEKIEILPTGNPLWMMETEPFKMKCKITTESDDGSAEISDITKDGFPIEQQGYTVTSTKSMTDLDTVNIIHTVSKDVTYFEDEGQFTCQSGGMFNMKIVKVFTVYIQDFNITAGEDASIGCTPQPSIDQLSVIWFKLDQKVEEIPSLASRIVYSNKNHTMTIKNATAADAGEYTCSIVFYGGTKIEQKFKKTVKLFGKPKIMDDDSSKSGLKVMKNVTLNLKCTVAGYPRPDVIWLKNGEIIKEQNIGSWKRAPFTLTHVIKNLSMTDVGDYSCSFENVMGRVTKTFVVNIIGFDVNGSSAMVSGAFTSLVCIGWLLKVFKQVCT